MILVLDYVCLDKTCDEWNLVIEVIHFRTRKFLWWN